MILTHGSNSIGSGGGDVPAGFKKLSFIEYSGAKDSFSFNRPDGLNSENKYVTIKFEFAQSSFSSSKIVFSSLSVDIYTSQISFSYPYTGTVPNVNYDSNWCEAIVYNTNVKTNYGEVNITSHPQPAYTDRAVSFKRGDSSDVLRVGSIKQEDGNGNLEFNLYAIQNEDDSKLYWYDSVSGQMWETIGTPIA